MKAKVKIFNCDLETCKKFYKDATKRAFLSDGIFIDENDIDYIVDELPGNTIQAQRAPSGRHNRTMSVYNENDSLKYIIGFTNTGLDEDKRIEVERSGGKYKYNNSDWHSNTYICQGINKIFEYYFDSKKEVPNVKLFFYLLDLKEKTYPHNKSNLLCYRELATIGYDILNIDQVNFSNFNELGFNINESHSSGIAYVSFNKYANDLLMISRTKRDNMPSYLKKINKKYNISSENDFESDLDYDSYKTTQNTDDLYTYTFKALGAQAYDSMLVMWTLYVLAQKEHKKIEFEFSSEKYNFRLDQTNTKMTKDFPESIKTLFTKANIQIHYVTSDEALQQFNRENTQYEIAHQNGILRNQELFKNNMREKGVPTRCYLCGCELEDILEAAHLWSVSDIKLAGAETINDAVSKIGETKLLDITNPHHKELFYKKYMLANNGDNGIWLCKNHHGLFDRNFFCFDSEFGKILIKTSLYDGSKEFFGKTLTSDNLMDDVLNNTTKCFLEKRNQTLTSKLGSFPYEEYSIK